MKCIHYQSDGKVHAQELHELKVHDHVLDSFHAESSTCTPTNFCPLLVHARAARFKAVYWLQM